MSAPKDDLNAVSDLVRELFTAWDGISRSAPGSVTSEQYWQMMSDALLSVPPPMLVMALVSYGYTAVALVAERDDEPVERVIQRLAMADELRRFMDPPSQAD